MKLFASCSNHRRMKYAFECFLGAAALEQMSDVWTTVLKGMTRVRFFHQRYWHEAYVQTLLDDADALRFLCGL